MKVLNHIEVRDGRGYIRDTNKKAELVARMYVGTDYTIQDVMSHYDLSPSEVHSAIAYYYDNQAELDELHSEAVSWAEDNSLTVDKLKEKIANRQSNEND